MQSSSSSSPRLEVGSPVLHELKSISCSKTHFEPTSGTRAVDARADKLQQEYIMKAHNPDWKYNRVMEGEVGRVERKLVELGEINGLVCGNCEVGEKAVVICRMMRRLGVAPGRAQSNSLLGRLESLGPGSAAARKRWWQAYELDGQWKTKPLPWLTG